MPRVHHLRSHAIMGASLALVTVLALSGCTAGAAPAASSSATAATPPTAAPVADGEDLTAETSFTALTATTITTLAPVKGSDEKVHITYELLLTNATALPFALSSIDVADASTGEEVLTIGPDEIGRMVTRMGAPADGTDVAGPVTLGGAETWIAWIDVALDPDAPVPTQLTHTANGALQLPAGEPAEIDAVINTVAVNDVAAPVVSAPVEAGTWFMSEGCCVDDTHHRRGFAPINGQQLVPQRYAIDFYKVDEQGRTWEGDPSKLESYFSYRQPILAAASGTVVRSVDGFENSDALPEPPKVPPIDETVGNHVVVEISPGVYALYGHMDPGSVRVKVGDKVEKGQELGLIGTSGNSTTPHLHFHLQNAPTFFPSDGLPWVFDDFTLVGSVTDRIWDDNLGLQPTGQLPFVATDPSERHDEMPLDRTVVRFD